MANCPYCLQPVHWRDAIVICPSCATSYHKDCWVENGSRCGMHLCPGSSHETAQPLPGVVAIVKSLSQSITLDRFIPNWLVIKPGTLRGWIQRAGNVCIVILMSIWIALLLMFTIFNLVEIVDLVLSSSTIKGIIFFALCVGIGLSVWAWQVNGKDFSVLIYSLLGGATGWGISLIMTVFLERSKLVFISNDTRWIIGAFIGALAGAFWKETQNALLRAGFGTALGLYFTSIATTSLLSFSSSTSYLTRLVLMIAFILIPLMFPLSVKSLGSAFFASLLGCIFFWLSGHAFPAQVGSLSLPALLLLLGIPISGALLGRYRSHLPQFNSTSLWKPTFHESFKLLEQGITGGAYFSLMVGSVIVICHFAMPSLSQILSVANLISWRLFHKLLPMNFSFGLQEIGLLVGCIYVISASFGILSRSGVFEFIHKLLRFSVLLIGCFLLAILSAFFIQDIWSSWNIFEALGSIITRIEPYVYIVAICIGFAFTVIYVKQDEPIYFIWFSFGLWLVQLLVVSVSLSLLGEAIGLFVNFVFAQIPNTSLPGGFYDIPPEQVFPMIGAAIGITIGLLYFLRLWLRSSLGVIVDNVQRLTQYISGQATALIDVFLLKQFGFPGVVIFWGIGLGLLSVARSWLRF